MERIISLEQFPNVPLLFGNFNSNIKLLREIFNVKIVARDNLKIYGEQENIEKIILVIEEIKDHIHHCGTITRDEILEIIRLHQESQPEESQEESPTIEKKMQRSHLAVKALTPGQQIYLNAMQKHEIVFAIGPSGTGKTYLAVAMAIECLRKGSLRKIILVRPAVEAGEKLGFLPGDYQAKINPYLRPLYDSLQNLLEYPKLRNYLANDIIEVAPLAYMRGRTLESSFIILDEAQNTTPTQMKMFLTRLGHQSRMVVTGDITQTDLVNQEESGLVHAQKILANVSALSFVYLTKLDIVRHPLVQKIIEAYEKSEELEKI